MKGSELIELIKKNDLEDYEMKIEIVDKESGKWKDAALTTLAYVIDQDGNKIAFLMTD